MLRLFIAIKLPSELKLELANIEEEVGKMVKSAKWVAPENIHLTLNFLGNCSLGLVPQIKEQVLAACQGIKAFTFRLAEFGAFPKPRRARVFWLGVDKGQEELIKLQEAIEDALLPLGFEKETKAFHPHLTLARFKIPQNLQEIIPTLKAERFSQEVFVDKVTLFKSKLTPKGAIYTALAHFSLKRR